MNKRGVYDMNKKKLYIAGIVIALLLSACSSEDTEELIKMDTPESSYIQEEAEDQKSIVENNITEKNDLRALLIDTRYYIALKDEENTINHFSWYFNDENISATKLNGYTTTKTIPYQINENILSVSIDERLKTFSFVAEDSDYLILEELNKDDDTRLYKSVEKSNTFFSILKEENIAPIITTPKTVSELEKAMKGNTFFLAALKDSKKALFKLDFGTNKMVTINAIEGYSLMVQISYSVEDNTLKFNNDQRVFDSEQEDYLLFTDNSRLYKNQTEAKTYLDNL